MTTLPSLVRHHLVALRVLILLTVVLGIAYPLVVFGVGQLGFRSQAAGSTVHSGGHVVGSSLLGQSFTDAAGKPLPQWFAPRPSVAGEKGYDPTSTGASNLGPNSPALAKAITERRAQVAAFDSVPGFSVSPSQVPADAVTASGSGLDPHISVAYADEQVARVARARSLSTALVRRLVAAHTQGRTLGILGEPRVNVLELNVALSTVRQ